MCIRLIHLLVYLATSVWNKFIDYWYREFQISNLNFSILLSQCIAPTLFCREILRNKLLSLWNVFIMVPVNKLLYPTRLSGKMGDLFIFRLRPKYYENSEFFAVFLNNWYNSINLKNLPKQCTFLTHLSIYKEYVRFLFYGFSLSLLSRLFNFRFTL